MRRGSGSTVFGLTLLALTTSEALGLRHSGIRLARRAAIARRIGDASAADALTSDARASLVLALYVLTVTVVVAAWLGYALLTSGRAASRGDHPDSSAAVPPDAIDAAREQRRGRRLVAVAGVVAFTAGASVLFVDLVRRT